MKTLKTLKITSVLQGTYCAYCLISILLVFVGTRIGAAALVNAAVSLYLLTFAAAIHIIPSHIIPYIVPVCAGICFFINLVCFVFERKSPEQRKFIGKKWIWIFVWPITVIVVSRVYTMFPWIMIPFGN